MTTPTPLPIPGAITPGSNIPFLGPPPNWPSVGPFAFGGSYFVFAFSQYNGSGTGHQDGLPSTLSAWRTDDAGVTWALVDVANSPSLISLTDPAPAPGTQTVEARVFWAVPHPNTANMVWLVYLNVAGAVEVSEFNMATSLWGSASVAGPTPPLQVDALLPSVPQFAVLSSAFGGADGETLHVLGWEFSNPGMADNSVIPATYTLTGGIGGAWANLGTWPGLPPLGFLDFYRLDTLMPGRSGRVHGFFTHILGGGGADGYHYLVSDGSGGSGAAPNPLPAGITKYFWGACMVNDTMVVTADSPVDAGLLHATEAAVPAWTYDPAPLGYFPGSWGPLLFADVNTGSPVQVARLLQSSTGPDETVICEWTVGGSYSPALAPDLFYADYYLYLNGRQTGSFGIVGGSLGGGPMVAFLSAPSPASLLAPTPEGQYKENILKPPNYFDCCLEHFRRFVESNLNSLQPNVAACEMVEMPGGYMMPAEGREWYERASIITPAINPAPGQLVLDFQCPSGYRGLLYGITNVYLGAGFVQGSGDLIWRLQIGNAWVRDMGEMLYMLGAVGQPFPLSDQYLIAPNQRVRMFVQTVNASGLIQVGVARMVMELQGWWMPE